jgi:hypothetical protein
MLAEVAKNDYNWEVCMAMVERLTYPEALKSVAERYLESIYAITGSCDEYEWRRLNYL